MSVVFEKESYEIVGGALAVYNALRYGFLEKVYENSLAPELAERGFATTQQTPVTVMYKGREVGHYVMDILVNQTIVLEIKAGKEITPEHVAQTLNYLRATDLKLGIILNFGPKELTFKRLVL